MPDTWCDDDEDDEVLDDQLADLRAEIAVLRRQLAALIGLWLGSVLAWGLVQILVTFMR